MRLAGRLMRQLKSSMMSGEAPDRGDAQCGRRSESTGRRCVGTNEDRDVPAIGEQISVRQFAGGAIQRGFEQIEDAVVFHLPNVLKCAALVRVEAFEGYLA